MSWKVNENELAERFAHLGSTLHTCWRVLLYQKDKVKHLNESERDEVLVMSWRLRRKIVQLAEEMDRFDEAFYSLPGVTEEKPPSLLDRVKGKFWNNAT